MKRAQLGVMVQPVTSDMAANLGLTNVRGAIVSNVDKDSAAAKAGVERGDVILKFDGRDVKDPNSLKNRIAEQQPGTQATMTVLHAGHEQQLDATLGEAQSAQSVGTNSGNGTSKGRFGMTVQPLTPDIARQIQVDPSTRGLVVTDVDPFGKAANAGLQKGDVIEQVNGQSVTVSASSAARSTVRAAGRPCCSSTAPGTRSTSRFGRRNSLAVRAPGAWGPRQHRGLSRTQAAGARSRPARLWPARPAPAMSHSSSPSRPREPTSSSWAPGPPAWRRPSSRAASPPRDRSSSSTARSGLAPESS